VDLPRVVEELKSALVHQASAGFGLEGKQPSDARVSLLTGVHRKDVRRLRELPATADAPQSGMSTASSVVARWISDPHFLNFDQTPMRLARSPRYAGPGQADFSALVACVSTDTSARTVLDELLRLGVVRLEDDTLVALVHTSFVPEKDTHSKFQYLAAGMGDHLHAAVSNLSPTDGTKPMLDQSAFSEGLDARQAALLHEKARALWTHALQKFLVDATIAEERSEGTGGDRYRVRFGSYFLEEPQKTPVRAGKARKRSATTKGAPR
jgi:hypothetical protein